jgi:hypothetical protein
METSRDEQEQAERERPRVLLDRDGVRWVCTKINRGRSSYTTYECKRLDDLNAKPRMISVPSSWDLDDPENAIRMLS